MRLSALGSLALLALLGACNLPAGGWFLELAPHASAAYVEVPERVVEPGWQKLASDYQVHLTAGSLQASSIELLAAVEGAAAVAFDPAHPPEGYGPCHNGHCHTADGRLVSYEDVAAAASGGAPAAAVTLAGATWDLLAPAALPLSCTPDCRLGHVAIDRVRVNLMHLHLEGVVRDGPGVTRPIGSVPFVIDLAAPLPAVTAALDLPADNQHPPKAAVGISLALGAALLDPVIWADGVGPPALASMREALAEVPLSLSLQRSTP